MAKRIKRHADKKISKSKEKEKLDQIRNATRLATVELSKIEKQIRANNKTLEDSKKYAIEAELALEERKDILEVVNDEIRKNEIDCDKLCNRETETEDRIVSLEKKEKEIKKSISKLGENKKSYNATFTKEKEELEASMIIARNEMKNKVSDIMRAAKEDNEKLMASSDNLRKDINAKKGEVDLLKGAMVDITNKIASQEETLENEKAVIVANIEKEVTEARKEVNGLLLKKINADKIFLTVLEKIKEAEDIEQKQKEKNKVFKEALGLLEIKLTDLRETSSKELGDLKDKKEIESKELDKIISQKFAIMKARKDLNKLHIYIKDLYEKANVPMPKIDLSI